MAIKPEDVLRVIADGRGDAICVPTMTTGPAWREMAPDDLSVSCVGFMGGASSIGLGMALARPDRRVIVFDGDGSLLMQMGCLSTIASRDAASVRSSRLTASRRMSSSTSPSPRSDRSTVFTPASVSMRTSSVSR